MSGLTIVNGHLHGEAVGVRCADGRIDAVGPTVAPQDGDEVLDARGGALVPPTVNAHTHAAMTLFRGFGDDMALMEWLQTRIWPAEARLTGDDVYWGTRLACVEMIRSGTASFVDMYWHGPDVARAVADSGLRAWVSTVFLDGGDEARGREQRPRVLDELDQIAEAGPLVQASLGPHAVYTVSRPSLAWLGETAAERGAMLHIHCSETEGEVADCVAAHGLRPPELLDALGVLGPSAVLAHGCWFDDGDLDLVADHGATVVTNPVSNMKLAVGRTFPILDAMARGIPLGLGTDGAASNNSLDLLGDVKVLSLLTKHTTGDPSALPAAEALAVARGQRSPLLGGHELEVGARADIVVISMNEPETAIGDLDADLAYAATGAAVDSTVVAGRVLMEHREIPESDDVIATAREHAARVRG